MSLQAIFGQAITGGLTAYVHPGADPKDDSTLRNLLSMAGFKPADASPFALNKAVTDFQKQAFPEAPAEWDGKAGPKTLQALQTSVNARMVGAPNAEEKQLYRDSEDVQKFLGLTPPKPNLNAPAPDGSTRLKSSDPGAARLQLDQQTRINTGEVARLGGMLDREKASWPKVNTAEVERLGAIAAQPQKPKVEVVQQLDWRGEPLPSL
jgi:hypothetical protein